MAVDYDSFLKWALIKEPSLKEKEPLNETPDTPTAYGISEYTYQQTTIAFEEALNRCASLKRVTFMPGSNLELIGHYAFAESALESIEIPSSVIELGDNCFCDCRSLRYVRFMPGGNWWRIVLSALVAIGDDPIDVEDDVSRYLASWIVDEDDNDDYVFNIKKVGKHAFASTAISSIAIPASVEEIGDHCFRRCGSLREVRFAEGCHVKKIGESAFADSGLESIEIPQSVEVLAADCFSGCASLSCVTFVGGSHVRMMGAYAFAKSGLASIEIPSSVDELGDYCFADCEHLQDIYIGHDLMLPAMGKRIFAGSSVQRIHVRSERVRDFFERCLANAEFGDLATAPEIILDEFRYLERKPQAHSVLLEDNIDKEKEGKIVFLFFHIH